MKKALKFVLMAVFAFGSLNTFGLQAVSSKSENSKQYSIMCIGDSITDGYGISGSYRKFLYNELTKKGYSIDMTGSKSSWGVSKYADSETGEEFEYDDDNTGYSGYSIKSYSGRNGIYETLVETNCLSQNPDVVILQIGTNNIIDNHDSSENARDISELMTYILDNIPEKSMLFVTSIPNLDPNRSEVYDWFGNYRHSADWQTQYSDDEVEIAVAEAVRVYNNELKTQIKERDDSRLIFADINSVITDVKTQLADGVHPNNTGYSLMGKYWAEKIDCYLHPVILGLYSPQELEYVSDFLLNNITGNELDYPERLDANKDGVVDIFDIIFLRKRLAPNK